MAFLTSENYAEKVHQNVPLGPVFSAKIFILKYFEWKWVFVDSSGLLTFESHFPLKFKFYHETSWLFNLSSRESQIAKTASGCSIRSSIFRKNIHFWKFWNICDFSWQYGLMNLMWFCSENAIFRFFRFWHPNSTTQLQSFLTRVLETVR